MALLRTIGTLVRLMRVTQWTKNALVLMPLVFARQLLDAVAVGRSLRATLAFCLAASSAYILNDILDLEQDRRHPEKSRRPLPRGEIRPACAGVFAAILLALALLLAFRLNAAFFLALLAYLGLTAGYSLLLKHVFLLDVIVLATGFVLRAMAGAVALEVAVSNWLIVCTFFLALFLALGKRRGEIVLLRGDAPAHRQVLGHYRIAFIDHLLVMLAGCSILAFAIYSCSTEVAERLGTDRLYLTLPFVVYGLTRYLWLVQSNRGSDPSRVLLKDRPTGAAVVLWILACVVILYA